MDPVTHQAMLDLAERLGHLARLASAGDVFGPGRLGSLLTQEADLVRSLCASSPPGAATTLIPEDLGPPAAP
ncbi:MAG: hypothetical protein H6739_27775 [Alphaproteobacteria bacterium]|nr:hypothetical protein [Alphaproteobacteria bacterium]